VPYPRKLRLGAYSLNKQRHVESLFIRGLNSTRQKGKTNMFKSTIAAAGLAAVALAPTAAFAGPYVNIESNSGFVGSDYGSTVTDAHVGYEGSAGDNAGYYVQAGPALVSIDGEDLETELSGKAGIGFDVSESVNVYGEVSFLTDGSDDANYGTKLGVKFTF